MNGFITHTDADGIISALLFKHYNQDCKFKGFYSTKIFNLTSKLQEDDIAIDLDMNNMKCIGHHINPVKNEEAQNPNKIHLQNFYNEYTSKCPFNTVLLLVNEYQIKIKDIRQLALIVFADGLFTFFDKYKNNCLNWLDKYKMRYGYTMFMVHKEKVMEIINKEIVPIFTNDNDYSALRVDIRKGIIYNKDVLRKFNQYVINAFKLNVSPDIFDVDYQIYKNLTVCEIKINNEEEYNNIVNDLNYKNGNVEKIISAALKYKNLLVYTYETINNKGFTQ